MNFFNPAKRTVEFSDPTIKGFDEIRAKELVGKSNGTQTQPKPIIDSGLHAEKPAEKYKPPPNSGLERFRATIGNLDEKNVPELQQALAELNGANRSNWDKIIEWFRELLTEYGGLKNEAVNDLKKRLEAKSLEVSKLFKEMLAVHAAAKKEEEEPGEELLSSADATENITTKPLAAEVKKIIDIATKLQDSDDVDTKNRARRLLQILGGKISPELGDLFYSKEELGEPPSYNNRPVALGQVASKLEDI